jgi:uncharacterized membrane protein
MTLQPLLAAGPAIQIHAVAALLAFGIGIVQLIARKGSKQHRRLGYIWAAAMMTVAITSFWIHEIRQFGDYSLIHVLSVFVIVSVPMALAAARSGRVNRHKKIMLSTFFFALITAGAFTLLPGRIMYRVLIGG